MIADPVLRFEPQAVAEGQIGTNLVIVLEEQSCVEEAGAGLRVPADHIVFLRAAGQVSLESRVDIVSIETRC